MMAASRARSAGRRIISSENVAVHETRDGDVVIVAFTLVGRAGDGGATYRANYIRVVTVRDGRIVRFRGYIDPAVFAGAGAR